MLPIMLIVLCGLMLLSVPVAVAIGMTGIVGTVGFTSLPLIVIPQQAYIALDKFPLAAVPFFILAGNIMGAGGISRRLVDLAESLLYNVRGGLAISCVLTCMIFSAVSGSSVATTYAIGAILIPAMVKQNYPIGFAASLQATSAELGVILPPSIPMIIYAISADTSVGDLFIAGIGPGLFIALTLGLYVWVWCRVKGYDGDRSEPRKPVLLALRRSALALLMPVVVLGGIYGGVFTPTESSVIAIAYALVVSLVFYRELTLKGLIPVFVRSAISASVMMFIISMAGLFSFLITRAGIPAAAGAWIAETFTSTFTFLLAVNGLLLVIGMFVETAASIIVLAPILAPVAIHFGISPVHFGMIMIVNLAMGLVTPPFGVNLFAASAVARISLERMLPSLIPFLLVMFGCLMVITYVPQLSTYLPELLLSR